MDKRKSPKISLKSSLTAPTQKENSAPNSPIKPSNIPTKLSSDKKLPELNIQITEWVKLFKNLNSALQDLYTICTCTGNSSFTDGAIDSIKHSLNQFTSLKDTQSDEPSLEIDEADQGVDANLLREMIDEGMTPAQALVMLIREKAAEETDDEEVQSDDLSASFIDEEKRPLSLSPTRSENVRKLEERLLKRSKLPPWEVKKKLDERLQRANFKKWIREVQRQEEASRKSRKIQLIKEQIAVREAEKKRAIELHISFKQNRADERYEAHLNSIRKKAKSENIKTSEVAFYLEMTNEAQKITLDQKIEETRERRKKALESIKNKQTERLQKEEAAEKRRQAMQNESKNKLITAQQKLEEAENRRAKILVDKKIKAEELGKRREKRQSVFVKKTSSLTQIPKSEELKGPEDEFSEEESLSSEEDARLLAYKNRQRNYDSHVKIAYSTKRRRIERVQIPETTVEWCSICNHIIQPIESQESHIQSESHQAQIKSELFQGDVTNPILIVKHAAELKQLRENYLKKRAKKVRTLAKSRSLKHEKACIMGRETSGPNKNRLQKLSIDLEKTVTNLIDYTNLENIIKDTIKLLDQRRESDLHVIRQLKFIPCIMEVIKKIWSCPRHEIKFLIKSLESITKLLSLFSGLVENRTYMMVTDRLISLADLVNWILGKSPKVISGMTYLPQLFHILTTHLKHRLPSEYRHYRDMYVEYLMCCGLLGKLKQKFRYLQSPVDLNSNTVSLLLLKSVGFLEALTTFPDWNLSTKPAFVTSTNLTENSLYIFEETEMAGIPYLLVCVLLSQGPPKQSAAPRIIPQTILSLSILSIRFLNNLARIHLPLFQETLNSEEFCEEVFHIFHFVLRYCTEHLDNGPEDVRELLHEIILLIGYFVTLNYKNQNMMNRGETCILQRLCGLPFGYFTDKKYTTVLFPTLIAICFNHSHNLSILHQEISVDLLLNYIKFQCQLYPEGDDSPSEDRKDEARPRKHKACSISSSGSSSKSILAAASFKLIFPNRFPRHLWEQAVEFLSTCN